jgi:hypothetical protein
MYACFATNHSLNHKSVFTGVAHRINSFGVVELSGRKFAPRVIESGPEVHLEPEVALQRKRRRREADANNIGYLPEAPELTI